MRAKVENSYVLHVSFSESEVDRLHAVVLGLVWEYNNNRYKLSTVELELLQELARHLEETMEEANQSNVERS